MLDEKNNDMLTELREYYDTCSESVKDKFAELVKAELEKQNDTGDKVRDGIVKKDVTEIEVEDEPTVILKKPTVEEKSHIEGAVLGVFAKAKTLGEMFPKSDEKMNGICVDPSSVGELDKFVSSLKGTCTYMPSGLLSDRDILIYKNIISPIEDHVVRIPNVLSYGLEPYGYTFRLGNEYGLHIGTDNNNVPIDPKNATVTFKKFNASEEFVLPPNTSIIVSSMEEFEIPDGVTANICLKTSYIRAGALASFGVVDSGYKGTLSFCIYNTSRHKGLIMYPGEGLAQIQFFRPESDNLKGYNGKFQNSDGVTV